MNTSIHVVIAGLLPAQGLAAEAVAGLPLPALGTLLARGHAEPLGADTLEDWLCEAFGISGNALAPVLLQAEGIEPGSGYWMRADPVTLSLMRDQVMLQPAVQISTEEAQRFCAGLNDHFVGDGLQFIAPHPQRWYLKLESAPDLRTRSLMQVAGQDMHAFLPEGENALRWHGFLNEVQMLLHSHALNAVRESSGLSPVSGVWFWGGGRHAGKPAGGFSQIAGDSELAMAVGRAASIPCTAWQPDSMLEAASGQSTLFVVEMLQQYLQAGDLAGWRDALSLFERHVAMPLLRSLGSGVVDRVILDVLRDSVSRRHVVTRRDLWKLWRRPANLADIA